MSIKVMICLSNMLFAEGIVRILEDEDDIAVKNILKVGASCTNKKLETINPDVILVDFITLYNAFDDVDIAKRNFVLLDTACGNENIVSAILSKKLRGVLLGDANLALFKRGIRAVASGEVWIDNVTVKNLLTGINALNQGKATLLSNREKEVVELIGQAYKNKEIAEKLFISEPTVKAHLRRIFQKLDIKNRSQLITYALKNNYDGANFYSSRVNPTGVRPR